MSLIIIGKMGFAALGIAVASVGGVALARWLNPQIEIYGFVTTVGSGESTDGKNLECQIPNFNKFACTVGEVTKLDSISNSKNNVLLEKLTGKEESKEFMGKLDKSKFYKIIIAESVFNSLKHTQQLVAASHTKSLASIEVFEKTDSSQDSIGNINVLSALKGGSEFVPALPLGSWKTTHFVGQALEDAEDISGYKCSWDQNDASGKECTIKPFVKDDVASGQSTAAKIESLTFTKDITLNSTKKITQHHYYLIEFKEASDEKNSKTFTGTEIVYLKDNSDDKATFKKLSAAKVVGEQLLILKKHPEA